MLLRRQLARRPARDLGDWDAVLETSRGAAGPDGVPVGRYRAGGQRCSPSARCGAADPALAADAGRGSTGHGRGRRPPRRSRRRAAGRDARGRPRRRTTSTMVLATTVERASRSIACCAMQRRGHAAIWMRDLARASEASARHDRRPASAAAGRAARDATLEAGIAALEGRDDSGGTGSMARPPTALRELGRASAATVALACTCDRVPRCQRRGTTRPGPDPPRTPEPWTIGWRRAGARGQRLGTGAGIVREGRSVAAPTRRSRRPGDAVGFRPSRPARTVFPVASEKPREDADPWRSMSS